MINRLIDYDLPSSGYERQTPLPEQADPDDSFLKSKLESFTEHYPVALIAAGLAAGVFLGCWVKRKS